MKFLEAFANIFRVPDLRKRLLFTLGLLAVYRLGGHVPTPGINTARWTEFFNSASGSLFSFFDMFAGGNIRRLTVFALGIMPYITASIILQLLTVVVPTLEKLQKEANWAAARSPSGPVISPSSSPSFSLPPSRSAWNP
jgi:preprotein translocase subunit SecY